MTKKLEIPSSEELALAAMRYVDPNDVTAVLLELSTRYVEAAKLIDRTITGAWVCRDEGDGTGFDRVISIYLEREHRPFIMRVGK